MFPRFDADADRELIAKGMNASPGAAVGKAVFDSDTAVEWAERGEEVILVRRETNPDDLRGMVAARGILTSRGGKTSHAAVVARGMGRTCVCGADSLTIDVKGRRMRTRDGVEVAEGDAISIDGTTGEVFSGEVPVVDSLVVRYFEGDEAAEGDELVAAVARLMEHADSSAPPRRAGQRRHPGRRGARPPVRRAGHRAVPHRAHVPRRPEGARGEPDPGRVGRRAGEGARRAAADAARRLRRDPRGDGRAAGDDPADRPAAARVPPRLHRPVGRGRARTTSAATRDTKEHDAARGGEAAARGEPDARAARGPARHRDPRACSRCRPGRSSRRRRCGSRPAATRSRRS